MKQLQSDNINELAAALSKAQASITHAQKHVDNTFFKAKYADLPAVIDAAKSHLSANGLSVTQMTDIEGDNVVLVTQLNHSSGQWIRSWYPIKPVKPDPQGMGSAVTYARRYAYSAMVGVAAIGEDDDGNAASGNVSGGNEASAVKQAKSVFSNAALRNKYSEMTIALFESCETVEDLTAAAVANKPKFAEMDASGNEHDALAVEELRKRYSLRKAALEQMAMMKQQLGE